MRLCGREVELQTWYSFVLMIGFNEAKGPQAWIEPPRGSVGIRITESLCKRSSVQGI